MVRHSPAKKTVGKSPSRTTASKSPAKRPQKSQKATKTTPKVVKKKRYRPGTIALREIRQYQKSTVLLLRKLPFARLVFLINYRLKKWHMI